MRFLIFIILQLLIFSSAQAQSERLKPLKVSIKLSLIPFSPGACGEIYYHMNNQMAIGIETNIFATKPHLIEPKGGLNLDLPFSDYTQETRSYLLKYQYIVNPERQNYFQVAFNGGIGISHFREVVGYNYSSGGIFFIRILSRNL